jgi:type IV pilus assembly protein PilA
MGVTVTNRRHSTRNEAGYTLIEILVVILIVGILAAMALPAFLNQRGKAHDAEAKSQARTAQLAFEAIYTDDQDYTGTTLADLQEIEPTIGTGDITVTVVSALAKGYKVTAVSSKTNHVFTVENAGNATLTRTCADPGVGGCPTSGKW